MSTDHELKVGDKLRSPMSKCVHDVLAVVGRFAIVQPNPGVSYAILFDDGAWRSHAGGTPWTVVKPRWRADVQGATALIYDANRIGIHYGIAVYGNHIDGDVNEAAQAIVDLLNERFPA